jgi:hypothetical protein
MGLILLLAALAAGAAAILLEGAMASISLFAMAVLAILAFVLLARRKRGPDIPWIVVDGSNVMYWIDETPSLETVRMVVDAVRAEGFRPVVWFDANAGYLTAGRYLGPQLLSGQIGVPARQVFVAEKGVPADPLILQDAKELRARVVTNDRYRDWAERFPKVQEPGFLVRGRIRDGAVSLRLQVPAGDASRPVLQPGRAAPSSR